MIKPANIVPIYLEIDTGTVYADEGLVSLVPRGVLITSGILFNGALVHGSLESLTADDHIQYILIDGTRPFTGTVSGITPVADAHLATKGYVDTAVVASTAGVASLNTVTGTVTVEGAGEVAVTTVGQVITVSGTPHTAGGGGGDGTVSNALEGADGITVTSGTSVDTITGFRTEFLNASGTLSAEIDSDIATHAADASAHHIRYTRDENDAITGADGITIVSGSNTIQIQGFRTEFVSASGALQADIDAIDSSVTLQEAYDNGDGVIDTLLGKPVVIGDPDDTIFPANQALTVSGSTFVAGSIVAYRPFDGDPFDSSNMFQVGTTTVTGIITARGRRDFGFVSEQSGNASPGLVGLKSRGTIGDKQPPLINTTSMFIQGAGWDGTQYRSQGAIAVVAAATPTSTSSPGRIFFLNTPPGKTTGEVALVIDENHIFQFQNQLLTSIGRVSAVSGTYSKNLTVSGIPVDLGDNQVGSINSLQNVVSLVGKGEVVVSTAGNTITVSGTPHVASAPPEGSDVDSINTATGTVTLAASDGITIVDETTNSDTPVLTVSGFRTEFVSASGALSAEIDSDVAAHAALTDVHHTRYTKDENDAITGSDGITVVSGIDTIDVQGFRTEFVTASGALSAEIDSDIVAHTAISDAHHTRYSKDENDAIVGGTDVTVVSGSNIITISSTAGGDVSDAMVGVDGITVLSGTPTESETTISGFQTEFVAASGSLQTQIDNIDLTPNVLGPRTFIMEQPGSGENATFTFSEDPFVITSLIPTITGIDEPGVTWTLRHDTGRNTPGTEVIVGGTNTHDGNTGQVISSFDNPNVSANSFIWFETTVLSGTTNELSITMVT